MSASKCFAGTIEDTIELQIVTYVATYQIFHVITTSFVLFIELFY